MPIASRTPEGEPFSCRLCGLVELLEPSYPTGDAVCPTCGAYLRKTWVKFEDLFPEASVPLSLETPLSDLEDSLDVVERVMFTAEEFHVAIDPDELARCETLADLIRYIQRLQGE